MANEAGGVFQTIGYLLSAEDLASPAVARAEAAVEASVGNIEDELALFTDAAEAMAANAGEAVNMMAGEFVDLDREAAECFASLGMVATGMGELADRTAPAAIEEVSMLAKIIDKASFGLGRMNAGISVASRYLSGFGGAGKVAGGLLQGLGNSLGAGGLMGFILGPIGPLLTMLTPLINVVSKVLSPAFEILGAAVENAFAPFQFILQTVAQSLAPKLQAFIGPFVEMLTEAAIQLGAMLQGVTAGSGFLKVMFDLVAGKLLPVAIRLVKIVIDEFARRGRIFVQLVERVGPALVKIVGNLLNALVPVIAAAVRLGGVLLEKVFAPILIATLEKTADLIEQLTPALELTGVFVGHLIDGISDRLDDFFGAFDKYMEQFYTLFIQPVEDGIADIIYAFRFEGVLSGVQKTFGSIIEFMKQWMATVIDYAGTTISGFLKFIGLESVGKKVEGIFGTIAQLIQAPYQTLRQLINENLVVGINKLIGWEVPVVGKPLGTILGLDPLKPFALGGVAVGPTRALIGEAGPEVVLPLREDVIRERVAPALAPALQMPELKEAVTILHDIHAAIREGLAMFAQMKHQERVDEAPRAAGLIGMA